MEADGGLDSIVGAINRVTGATGGLKVLDFGCGQGRLVDGLIQQGFDAYGCDVGGPVNERLRRIEEPYRLPFDSEFFDLVVSTSVLEHNLNKEEGFAEIRRVLKPGGYSIHVLPSKWYLPTEPHIGVPLVSHMWPKVPTWWLGLWALLGVRNPFQAGKPWREVTELNRQFCVQGLCYWSLKRLRAASIEAFGNFQLRQDCLIDFSHGGLAALCRRLPFRPLTEWVMANTRMMMIVSQKP